MSKYDTLGLSTLEANACGTLVVAADVAPFSGPLVSSNGARFELDDIERSLRDYPDGDRDTRVAVERFSVRRPIDEFGSIYGVAA